MFLISLPTLHERCSLWSVIYRIETKELRIWKLLTQSKVTHLKTIEVIFNIFFHESLSCFTSSRDEMFENYEFFIIHT